MRILHYALGFPPYRTGGLTKFCMDIMQQQKTDGHDVALIWPGQIKLFDRAVHVVGRSSKNGVGNYEVINPLPVSYDEGIVEVEKFTKPCEKKSFLDVLNRFQPDVIHVHTLMGLHREFIELAKELGIRTIFTVHDFFSICPKATLFRGGRVCDHIIDCGKCPQCNLTALSIKKIFLLQSPVYRLLKDTNMVKKLRKAHRDQYISGESADVLETHEPIRTQKDYQMLRNYYRSMIEMFDVVHANSSITRDSFLKVYEPKNIKVISISHSDIRDNRRLKTFSADKLRLTYLGPMGRGKGFFLLRAALDELWEEGQLFLLNVFFKPTEVLPYMTIHGRYNYYDLEGIFNKTDALVIPSIWYESFGYTALEAMSYGVPVIFSDHVGAKDVIPDGCGIVIEDIDKEKLVDAFKNLTTESLEQMNRSIMERAPIMTLNEMNDEIMRQCYKKT